MTNNKKCLRRFTSFSLILAVFLLPGLLKATVDEPEDLSHPKTLDGVYVQAVETYINPRHHEISFGVGLFPLNAYYNGFSGNIGYMYYFNSRFGWEVLNGSMVFSVQKDLTTQLAENYKVTPQAIERLNYVASSNLVYVLSYGKSVLFQKFLQYARTSALLGPGIVQTSARTIATVDLGFRFDGYINDTFSWRVEVRDQIAPSGFENFGSLALATCIYL